MPRKSPQDKKAESYKKDRRNTYGENSKASRRGIARKKRRQARAERRIARTAHPAGSGAPDLERFDAVADAVLRKRRAAPVLKFPDTPLGEVVARKLERRTGHGMVDAEAARRTAEKARRASPKPR